MNMKHILLLFFFIISVCISAISTNAQTPNWEESSAFLNGAIDVHVHNMPDSGPRAIDSFESARIARRYGMRALLFKNHFTHTASVAYLVNQIVPGIEVYGGIVLNNTAGRINPRSVEHMALTTGRLGRVVWMPTWDSEHYSKTLRPNPNVVPISSNGELLPEVVEVFEVMARFNLALATGHSSPEESLLLIKKAKSMGIERIIVTHPMSPAVGMTMEQQIEAARLGAYVEFCFNPLMPADTGLAKPDGGLPIETMISHIRAVGIENAIISTDLGQELNPLHTDGMIYFIHLLKEQGFTQEEIDRMCKSNPAHFLGMQ